jgi:hypothetical protein
MRAVHLDATHELASQKKSIGGCRLAACEAGRDCMRQSISTADNHYRRSMSKSSLIALGSPVSGTSGASRAAAPGAAA